jgi:glycosidase
VGLPARGERVDVVVPEIDGDYFVDLQVEDSDGVEDHASVRFRVDHGELLIVDAAREHPAWVDDAVVYGVAPFFFGGRLTDVIGRLDELAELGVTVLWLSPVTVASEGDFGYAVTDHFAVREDFGGDQALRELVDAAHQHGMRVIMDFVANHTAIEHPYVQARPDFYERDTNGELQHYFDWENLPNLDLDHPEVRAWLSAAFAYWVGEFGIDGFRADAAWGPAERSPDFWAAIRAELVRIEPDLLLLAEATARDSFYVDRGFDVAYDWTWEPGQWAWQEAFEQADAASLGAALTSDGEGFDPDAVIFRFLDNNDTGARFVTRHGVDRVPAAAAVLFTVPGIPSLWSGSEVGAELEPYDEGPPLTWDDPHGLSAVYRKLATLRRTLPALRGRSIDLVPVTGPDDVIAYLRPGESAVLVVVDLRGEPGEIALPWTPALEAMARGNSLRDAYHGENLPLTVDADVLRLTLPEDGVRVLVAKP